MHKNDEPPSMTTFEQLIIAAIVMGIICAVGIWLMLEHDDEVRGLFRGAIGKASEWVR